MLSMCNFGARKIPYWRKNKLSSGYICDFPSLGTYVATQEHKGVMYLASTVPCELSNKSNRTLSDLVYDPASIRWLRDGYGTRTRATGKQT
jgi:hypothetical protein